MTDWANRPLTYLPGESGYFISTTRGGYGIPLHLNSVSPEVRNNSTNSTLAVLAEYAIRYRATFWKP